LGEMIPDDSTEGATLLLSPLNRRDAKG